MEQPGIDSEAAEKAAFEAQQDEIAVSNSAWSRALRSHLTAHPPRKCTPLEREQEVSRFLTDTYKQREAAAAAAQPSRSRIPRFFFRRPTNDDRMSLLLLKEARTRFLHRRSQELLTNEDLERLWNLLLETSAPNEDKMNYDSFTIVGAAMQQACGPKCAEFFSPSVFLKFTSDALGRIPIGAFFNHVMRRVSLRQTRLSLSLWDAAGDGFLREQDLENYIFDLIPTLPRLQGIEQSFFPFYVCTAVRQFFFFLDPMRKGKVPIREVLTCAIHSELMELRDENLPDELEDSNWFSARSVLRVYREYLQLDVDHNGMLSREELSAYGRTTLTSVFLDRVFQECHMYGGEMDYKAFLDFVLAMENKKSPQSLGYFFRLLDIRNSGALTAFEIHFFFKGVLSKMEEAGHELVNPEDVRDEIFDMVRPKDPLKITLKDLVDSGVGDVVVSMLTDMAGFWDYDNRESLLVDEFEQDGGVEGASP